jgi:hypothetical protein
MCLLWHTAEPVGHEYPGKGTTGPREAAAFCVNHPEVKVIFAHLGGGLWLYELMPEMNLYLSNAMYDLAALPWLYGPRVLDAVEAAGVAGKFLMGTDFPILDSPRYEKNVSCVVFNGRLQIADQKRQLYGIAGAAARIFRQGLRLRRSGKGQC